MSANELDAAVATARIDGMAEAAEPGMSVTSVAAALENEMASIGDVGRPYSVGRTKRCLDVAASVVLIALFLPLMAIVFVLVRLTSRGPAIFVQMRRGLDGRPFPILKFRSMRVSGDDEFRQASRGDARVTPIGRVLRKYSIDEVPQFFNVLAGHMSIVGPRPHAMSHDAVCSVGVNGYERRLRTKPGITGLAQVKGHRGETPDAAAMQARVDLDLEYVANASLLLDLRLIATTALAVVRSKNVY